MDPSEILNLVRGPAFNTALAIFVFGMILRLFEVLSLGRQADFAESRSNVFAGGLRTIIMRSIPRQTILRREPLRVLNGFIFHVGFLVVLLLYRPHIEIFDTLLGISWSGLPSGVIDAIAAVTIISLIAALLMRLNSPVLRLISTKGDTLAWIVTLLPMITGYMAYNHLFLDYTLMLAIHILSIELLLIVAPFTKLTHMFGFVLSRWFQGCLSGRRGVKS